MDRLQEVIGSRSTCVSFSDLKGRMQGVSCLWRISEIV